MAAIIPGVPGEDVDTISQGGWLMRFKNKQYAGCKMLNQFLSLGIFFFFFFKSDRPFPFFEEERL